MNFKTTYILFGVMAGILGLLLLTQLFGTRAGDGQLYVLPSLHNVVHPVRADDIGDVEIDRFRDKDGNSKAEKIVLHRADKNWKLTDPDVRADNLAADQLVDQVIR